MTTFLVAAFLMLHGLVHLALWLPRSEPKDAQEQPFVPDRSLVLGTAVAKPRLHQLAASLAIATSVVYLVAGIAVTASLSFVVPVAVAAAVLGLVLKFLFFDPWLSLGLLIDVLVLTAALAEWPLALT